jgi:hypothetical protein
VEAFEDVLVWLGSWESPKGLSFDGFHLWDRNGVWHGVYKTFSRAKFEGRNI